ncbi:MAG: hypothetical protein EBT03_12315, partial [Betaproteobacteria bacterium]|nr:hypothetical protein [Betaproteobacteria bacterium]
MPPKKGSSGKAAGSQSIPSQVAVREVFKGTEAYAMQSKVVAQSNSALAPRVAIIGGLARRIVTLTMAMASFAFAGRSHAQIDLPPGVQMLVEEAEENYFDGDYANAGRLLREAETWTDDAANKLELARWGVDHSIVKVILAGLRAEIYQAQGEYGKARAALATAETTLGNRRSAYVARRIFPEVLWQYEAFLLFMRGDLMRPEPDFGLAEDTGLPADVRDFLVARGNPSESIRAYRRAEATLGKPMARQGQDRYQSNRLEGRMFTNLAWIRVLKAGRPSKQDISDAEACLERGETAFSRNVFWQHCFQEEHFGRIPRALKDIDPSVFGTKGTLKLKRAFTQAISDWTSMELLRVEMTAYQEAGSPSADDSLSVTTEQKYDRIVGFLKSQYTATHPRVQSVRLSRARWLVVAARPTVLTPETRFSLLQDCL